jgi:formate hydrogenlyase subunit 6/NADH:ubiquinone oxidoreductase subunit I
MLDYRFVRLTITLYREQQPMKRFRYLEQAPILTLDKETCTGCTLCATVCPHRVFTMAEGKANIADYGMYRVRSLRSQLPGTGHLREP